MPAPTSAESTRTALQQLLQRGYRAAASAVPAGSDARSAAVLLLFSEFAAHSVADMPPTAAHNPQLLLIKRAARQRYHPGQLAFPGGGLESQDASPTAAALRETREETGIDPTHIDVLGALPAVPLPVSNNVVTPVLGWWHTPTRLHTDPAELASAFTVPLSTLTDPANRATGHYRRQQGGIFSSPAFVLPDNGHDIVWGFTAFVLDQLLRETGWEIPWDRSRTVEIAA